MRRGLISVGCFSRDQESIWSVRLEKGSHDTHHPSAFLSEHCMVDIFLGSGKKIYA